MGFKPKGSGNAPSSDYSGEPRNFPVPKAGNRKARVSLIVDLGTQKREDYVDPVTKESKAQRPCHQIAVFADLTADVVDYGGSIGKQPYRLLLNKSFKGEITGINFYASAPKDADGNTIEGKPWGLHVQNAVSKVCKAVGHPEWADEKRGIGIDIEPMLNAAFLAEVTIKETPAKGDKKDKDGNPIVYKNVSYRGASALPMEEDEDGNETGPIKVPPLKSPAKMIGFDDATEDDIKWLRADIRKKIKLAEDYAGSAMQKAIEAYEAKLGKGSDDSGEQEEAAAPAPAPTPAPAKKTPKAKPAPVPMDDMDDDSVPF